MNSISIGIIGGMGPQASVLLHQKIVTAATEELSVSECHEFPLITHISIPAIDFISNPELRHRNTRMLQQAARVLASNKPDLVIIACNTAHILIDEVPALGELPLVSLPEAVMLEAKRRGFTTLGLIASPTTIASGLYEKVAEKHGITILPLAKNLRPAAEKAIREVIAGRPLGPISTAIASLAEELKRGGAEAVIFGCTELSVAMNDRRDNTFIDSLSATKNEVVRRIRALQEAQL